MRRFVAGLVYVFLIMAGIGALFFPPSSLWITHPLTLLLGWSLVVGGGLGLVGVIVQRVWIKLIGLVPLLAGIASYAVSAGAIIIETPSRMLQAGCLLALLAFLILRAIDLLESWRLRRVDRSS